MDDKTRIRIEIKKIQRRRAHEKFLHDRSQKSIDYAIGKILESPVRPYVAALYLFGSCARGEQRYESNVDLLLELDPEIDKDKYCEDILLLMGRASPRDLSLPEVGMAVVIGDGWMTNEMLIYQNIRRDGINIWDHYGETAYIGAEINDLDNLKG